MANVLNFPSVFKAGERPYDIFKDRMTAVSSIASGIKNIIANKFINEQNTMIAENIQNKIDEQKAIDLSNLILGPPPEEIYPDNLEDTVGQFYDKFAMFGELAQKEKRMGMPVGEMSQITKEELGLPAVGGVTPTPAPTTEVTIPKTDLYQLYNVIKDIPTGQMSWDNIYKKMTEKKPWFMGTTGSEEFVLNQMMGQVGDPRAKLASDINLFNLARKTFYPEAEKPTEWEKKTELFLKTDPTVGEVKEYVGGRIAPEKLSDFEKKWNLLMQRDHTREEEMKLIGSYVGTKLDINKTLENISKDPDIELSSLNVSSTGTVSYSFKPKDTKTAWEFDTWDEAVAFRDTHPQEGFVAKIETHGKGFDVTWYQKGTTDELKPITPSDIKSFELMIWGDEESPGIVTPEDYAKVKDYVTRTEKNFPMPEYLKIAEMNLSKCLNVDSSVLDIELYRYFYEFYKVALKGKPPKYLPPEFILKTGFFKNKYGSALADDYELDFEAMKKDNVTEENIWKEMGGVSP